MGDERVVGESEREGRWPEEWTDDERRAFRLRVDALRQRQRRAGQLFALVLIAIVGVGVALRLPESWWMPAVGAGALLGVGFRLANWKCPGCGERLSTRGSLTRCHGCGAPLD